MKKATGKSKIRKGTFCKMCGKQIFPDEEFIKAEGGCLGSVIYAHKACACYGDSVMSYYDENLEENHKETYSGFRAGYEFETMSKTTPEQRLQLYAFYGLRCTHDSTVTNEFKSGIINGLHGLKTMLDGINSIIDIAHGEEVGTHINASLTSWKPNDMSRIEDNACALFKPLLQYMSGNYSQTVEVWGRFFGDYRRYNFNFVHGSAIAIKETCIEYRIAKYQTTEQFFFLVAMIKEFTLILDKYLKNENPRMKADHYGKAILRAYKRRIDGTASYMSAERNKNS